MNDQSFCTPLAGIPDKWVWYVYVRDPHGNIMWTKTMTTHILSKCLELIHGTRDRGAIGTFMESALVRAGARSTTIRPFTMTVDIGYEHTVLTFDRLYSGEQTTWLMEGCGMTHTPHPVNDDYELIEYNRPLPVSYNQLHLV